jgi:hypothetical protein
MALAKVREMNFDRPDDPSPMTAVVAVSRGQRLVNFPVIAILVLGSGIGWILTVASVLLGVVVGAFGIVAAWIWWSYSIPLWRRWALERGADPEELQSLGVQAQLLWPRGSMFERTEFRRNGR